MDQSELKDLIAKIDKGAASNEELAVYNAYMNRIAPGYNAWNDQEMGQPEIIKQELWEKVYEGIHPEEPVKIKKIWPRIVAAASVIITFSVGGYFFLHKPASIVAHNKIIDIAPGGNYATLTLSNGQKINLSDAKTGLLNQQSGIKIFKNADGQLDYSVDKSRTSTSAYNTVETPNGGQYQVNLPDGTKVWINAASKLSYPERFNGKERLVELTGEAYFEVVHNDKMPFKVKTLNQTVEDLGTHFNINAYKDESTLSTTLLEGSVRVSAGKDSEILKPGQQSQIVYKNANYNILVLNEVNTEQVTAWKNGYFRFNNEKIAPVMRQLSRWYNIDVIYEGEMSDESYYGKISRYKNISQVLKMLEKTKSVRFEVEGRRVTVIN